MFRIVDKIGVTIVCCLKVIEKIVILQQKGNYKI
jgi:hypothetical protein